MRKPKCKISEFEFWPFWLFYTPFVPYWIWNSIKSGSFSYFCKANPGMEFGGFLDYSKFKILQQIPQEFIPKTYYIRTKNEINEVLPDLGGAFPFIAKPDIGERGMNVELIRNENEWKNYALQENLIIQEFVDWPLEFGIFYVRIPDEEKGKILSVTGKEFLTFVPDGKTTLREFISAHPRAQNRIDYLFNKFNNQLDLIHPKGTDILLEPIGNHNRGTRFYDASELVSNELTEKVDFVARRIQGFYYGRLDVKVKSIESFQKGQFKILEINGTNSEATHIYDPGFSLLKAYREIKRHLDFQYKIAQKNPKNHSAPEFYKAIIKRIF